MTLELKNVVKRVGAETHIYDTSLTLEAGQFNILLGTTLSGKTTLMRLMAGLLAGQRFSTTLRGDESLNGRHMARIVTPLTRMGAAIETDCDGTPPLQIAGGLSLRGIHYDMPVASAASGKQGP